MNVEIRIDRENGPNTIFSVFIEDVISGKLIMQTEEAEEFCEIVKTGCDANGDSLIVTDGT